MDRGIPTEETLTQMRQSDPPVSYLVGTPKGRLSQLEAALAQRPWQQGREGVTVKLLPQEGEWVSRIAGVVAGEGKAVTSDQPRAGEKAATRQEASIRRPEKTAVGELRGEAFGAPDCDVQYRACRWWARLRIGSLGTIFLVHTKQAD